MYGMLSYRHHLLPSQRKLISSKPIKPTYIYQNQTGRLVEKLGECFVHNTMLTKVYRFSGLARFCEELILLFFVAWFLHYPNIKSLRANIMSLGNSVNLDRLFWTGQIKIDLTCWELYQDWHNKKHEDRSSMQHNTRTNLISSEIKPAELESWITTWLRSTCSS